MRFLGLVALLLLTASDLDARILMGGGSASGGGTNIAFVNIATGATEHTSNITSYTMAYTPSTATNEMLVVRFGSLSPSGASPPPATTITYNGVGCNKITEVLADTNVSGNTFMSMFTCPLGTGDGTSHNMVATLAVGSGTSYCNAYIAEYSGVLQSSYIDASNSVAGASNPASVAITATATGDWIVAGGSNGANNPVISSSPYTATTRVNDATNGFDAATIVDSNGTVPASVSETTTWTISGSNIGAIVIALKHA